MFLRTVIRSVCLTARRRLTVPPLRQALTSEPHKHDNTVNILNKPHIRPYSRSRYPLQESDMPEADTTITSDTDDELEPQQDDHFEQEFNFADVLLWAYSNIIGQMGQSSYRSAYMSDSEQLLASMRKMYTSASILELQQMLKGGNNWGEMSVDFTVLVEGEPSKNDGSLNIKALKKGTPSLKDLKEEIWVVDPREKSWEPPKNVDIVNSKTYGEMMKLCEMATRAMPRKLDFENVEVPVHQDDPPLYPDENADSDIYMYRSFRNFDMVTPLRYAIIEEWSNQAGRDGFQAFLKMAHAVLHEQMLRAKIRPDYNIQFFVQNLGGSKGRKSANTAFAYSQLENDYVVDELDLTTAETEGRNEILDEKLQEIRDSRRWLHTESDFKKQTYTPDGKMMVIKRPRNPSHGMRKLTITGLLTGEVKSSSERVPTSANVFTSSCPYLRIAWTQSLIGLKYRNETAALVMSPKLAVFMQIEAKDGYIVTHVKKYNIMIPSKSIPDQKSYQELFTDLVQYLSNSYCSDFKN